MRETGLHFIASRCIRYEALLQGLFCCSPKTQESTLSKVSFQQKKSKSVDHVINQEAPGVTLYF